jgi:uncharacterized membrane protein required for colicin V production
MWLNVLAGGVLAACAALGAWRGALATGLGIASLLLAYAAAVFVGPALAPSVGEWLGVGAWIAIPVASSFVFFAACAVLGLVSRLLRRLGNPQNSGRSPRDRLLGGSFGAVRGLLIAMMLVYLAMWVDALRATGTATPMPEIGESAAADFTGEVVKSAIESTLDESEPTTRVAARFAASPAVSAVELQGVIEDPSFVRLRGDAQFWSAVENGNLDAAFRRDSFRNLENQAPVRQKLANLGLVPDEAALDSEAFRLAVAEVLGEVGPRLRGLRSDPGLRDLLEDPEVVAMIENGDTLRLLAHPGFRELLDRVTAAKPQQ